MIVRKNKTFETCSLYPSTDWYDEGNYIINETTEDGKALAEKIIKNAPYFDFVLDDKGKLIDINPTERPTEPSQQPTELEILKADNEANQQAIAELTTLLSTLLV